MATLYLDYDSAGDVLLLLEAHGNPEDTLLDETQSVNRLRYSVGPLGVKIQKVHLRVSSLKLISSSRYFRAMLQGSNFQEATELKERGFVKIPLLEPEDDPTAMMVIIGILYGKEVDLPESVDFTLLEKIATLVDKHEWHALVNPYATHWFDKLAMSDGLSTTFDDKLLSWLWMAWVFELKDHFKSLSRIAQQCATQPLDTKDEYIRLPQSVIQRINQQRTEAFLKLTQMLEEFGDDVVDIGEDLEPESPDFLARCLAFGFMIMHGQLLGLHDSDDSEASVCSIQGQISQMKPTQYSSAEFGYGSRTPLVHMQTYYEILKNWLRDLEIDNWGLDLDDFKLARPSKKDILAGAAREGVSQA